MLRWNLSRHSGSISRVSARIVAVERIAVTVDETSNLNGGEPFDVRIFGLPCGLAGGDQILELVEVGD